MGYLLVVTLIQAFSFSLIGEYLAGPGEEPYTLAMVLSEFASRNPGFDFQILATDISTRVLDKAQAAIYQEEQVEHIPLNLKKRYLLRSKDRNSGLIRIVPEP
ncbi:CheR family methyltransferase [Acidovorax sp. BLS4]|uniref:CheR family methyltransferase n=1 Tax=Acidovorax sp. BLS4 TaxID=3273430 RepID=UPI002942E6A1|nr:CheR family methyltransferase [Paracidovorax avenae]WOI45629.1 CheR family methyltransferase [Paracidovorax avenae]